MKKCIGFGEFERTCENVLTKEDNLNWCERCNKLRIKHIDNQFISIAKKVGIDYKGVK